MCIICRPLPTRSRFLLTAMTLWLAVGTLHAQTPPADKLEQVVLVFKTHFDIGYTDLASKVIDRYRTTMIDQALEVCDRNRDLPPSQQFAWTVPGWPMAQISADWPGQTPERKQRIEQALKDGRFVVHGLPFTTHTELLEPEDLVRGLGFASQVSRSVGLALPRDAKMTDVPCHSWIMPTLLRHAGIEFLHLGCNAASQSPQVPLLFWWEGPDGSRLLTMYVAEGYGTGLLPPANWPYRTWLGLIHTGDNHGPPQPEEVAKSVAELQAKRPGVQVRIGRLSDFADALLAENPQIPVVRGDMPDTWIHGPMCDPQGARVAHTVRPKIGTVESLNTLLRLWGVNVEDITPTVSAAYEQSLLYGEHTWGGALYWVSSYTGTKALVYGDEWKKLRGWAFSAFGIVVGRTHGLHRSGAGSDRTGTQHAAEFVGGRCCGRGESRGGLQSAPLDPQRISLRHLEWSPADRIETARRGRVHTGQRPRRDASIRCSGPAPLGLSHLCTR